MILAIRTDKTRAELYLLDEDGTQQDSEVWEAGRELSQQILPRIRKLLKQTKIEFKDLKGLIVFKGPGSFTGLRIGVSVANTFAYGLQIPVAGTAGKKWRKDGVNNLAKAKVGKFVVPEYGAEPNITKPKK